MKIVQSFWARPALKKGNANTADRINGGWPDRIYNYMSWALSCLQFRRIYGNVELVTDSAGYDLLIGRLQLPYTSVQVVLDELNNYHPDLWALGKIYAYRLQKEPFLHVDGDIYIWERFGNDIETAPLAAQNIEEGFSYYKDTYEKIANKFTWFPEAVKRDRAANNPFVGVCAGIIGGCRVDFIREYADTAIDFVQNNINALEGINVGLFNTFFEQYLFHCMAKERSLNIRYHLTTVNDKFDGLCDFTGVPGKVKFVHPVGLYKRRRETAIHMAHRLRIDHPDHYYEILNLLNSGEI
jgi:hypothetical protein